MTRTITWPSRAQWQANAGHAERTSCHAWQRVSGDPAAWMSADELAEARALAAKVVRAGRKALSDAGRADYRPTLNGYGREAAAPDAQVSDLTCAWTSILRTVDEAGVSSPDTQRLAVLRDLLTQAHRAGAAAAEEAAVRAAVAYRATDEAWAEEVRRRARVERGPQRTVITVHEDGSTTSTGPEPYTPPMAPFEARRG
ncbi:hypothetical protein [Kitasatospora sp. NPDC086791]|uniref:hypothetical protein n=1 Tax=Kitasatospora sp. NPDC086791 TaxID=3155178 RepID=UPI00341DABF4